MEEKINGKLKLIYQKWLASAEKTNGIFGTPNATDVFSNPYFFGVTEKWEQSDKRILFVGQEGYSGHWNSYDMNVDGHYINYNDISKLQEASILTTNVSLTGKPQTITIFGKSFDVKPNVGSFWNAMKDIATNQGKTYAAECAWTNIDLVCYNQKRNKRRVLLVKDRKRLHNGMPQVLEETIKAAKPTHVVFFSYRDVAAEHEFGVTHKVFSKAFLGKKDKVLLFNFANTPCLMTYYHPNQTRIVGYKNGITKAICDYIYRGKKDELIVSENILKNQ